MRQMTWVLGALFWLGCHDPLPPSPERPAWAGEAAGDWHRAGLSLSIEPDGDLYAAPPVLRLRVALPVGAEPEPGELLLFQGELSEYYLGRIARKDLPGTLTERLVPTVAWVEPQPGMIVVAPLVPLAPGERYSLASAAWGLVGSIAVRDADFSPYFSRLWPPSDAGCGIGHVVFCGDAPAPPAEVFVELDPGGLRARLAPGADDSGVGSEHCVHLRLLAEPTIDGPLLPPPWVEGVALDPAPLLRAGCEPQPPLPCPAGQSPLGVGCVQVHDDRLLVYAAADPTLWIVGGDASPLVEVLPPGGQLVVRGLQPDTLHWLEVSVVDLAGQLQELTEWVHTGPERPHVVINEVLANPLGPEPHQEWVELYNDGSSPVSLEGWVLEDVGGQTVLPEHWLFPGEFVVLVSERYVADTDLDVPPEEGVALVRLPRLGSRGLTNAGEPLLLRSPEGSIISRFPAEPKPRAGISVARQHPWSLDDDNSAFALHAEPGASPGRHNQLQ